MAQDKLISLEVRELLIFELLLGPFQNDSTLSLCLSAICSESGKVASVHLVLGSWECLSYSSYSLLASTAHSHTPNRQAAHEISQPFERYCLWRLSPGEA